MLGSSACPYPRLTPHQHIFYSAGYPNLLQQPTHSPPVDCFETVSDPCPKHVVRVVPSCSVLGLNPLMPSVPNMGHLKNSCTNYLWLRFTVKLCCKEYEKVVLWSSTGTFGTLSQKGMWWLCVIYIKLCLLLGLTKSDKLRGVIIPLPGVITSITMKNYLKWSVEEDLGNYITVYLNVIEIIIF